MYRIVIQPIAINLLREISDRRIRQKISDRIDKLKESSEMQGKPLLGELDGYYSVRAVGQRYRIIYVIEQAQVTVMIVALGIRKDGSKQDVYALAKKLLRLGLLDESEADRDDD
ncbi:MAG: type II toxin-antitoxin system RelE/ParE family toxin [Pseudanabaena sp. M135S2SP2A07QC]|jgi:mRNA interferase RelE/StbE|nr:type II toxin-antitoxin system RelE/ParE family toxin [Pseudanabaena sp. M090S1SP2A07QC]MCA6506745.1 type II toxin-antitoxin system RelE/ParE family toxin [Pseudanabaena sp. M172S2SP2A07QC]MCA6521354.1 type II toxin-antitoxin system RelE/ParE family toxin [Pseudanabaena sp. M051S1SP2A07QC]MCA6531995.1 type II toxin-antitoxin system RelE/ParE family toxin [Pseudanabaena sp. M125S2SP2A07QC]MCA6534196.1 type II toxin-antitoxin system RelE/ParE family toxin [Pseudanabaena sp. M176S2SP2A07QC]MCA